MTPIENHLPNTGDPSDALFRLINGFRVSRMISLAAHLGLADLLTDGPQHSAALAERTAMHPPSLYRLLRALSSLGVFHEDHAGRFELTPLSHQLRSDVPNSLRAWAQLAGDRQMWQAWGELRHSVHTGETAFSHVFGMDVWAYRAQHPEASALFNAAMGSLSGRDIRAVLGAYDWAPMHTIVDVGGGHGALLAAILTANPDAHGILYDRPHVVATATPVLEAAGVADRCELAGGDFFESVPPGADAYLLRNIIHDWDDEPSRAILRTSRAAMPAHGRLMLIEGVVQGPNQADPTKLSDINMLVMPGGRERTEDEYRALLAQAGFSLNKVYSTPGASSIIEGLPA